MRPPENCPLSQPEWEVLLATFAGGQYRKAGYVARILRLQASTISTHRANARRKLNAATNEDMWIIACRRGWIGPKGGARVRRDFAGGGEKPLSPALRAYLAAFDELLANHRDPDQVAYAREQMRHHLAGEVLRRRLPPELLRRRPRATQTSSGQLDGELLPGANV